MRLSHSSVYGLYALAQLASEPAGGCLSLTRIAQGTDLPRSFLSKVLQALGRAGLVWSARGSGGGFVLARPAGRISLLEAVEAIQGPLAPGGCPVKRRECEQSSICVINAVGLALRECEARTLAEKTIADLQGAQMAPCLHSPSLRKREHREGARPRRPPKAAKAAPRTSGTGR